MHWEAPLGPLAAGQQLQVARWQLAALGIARSTVSRRISAGIWTEPLEGVVAVAGFRPTPLARAFGAVLSLSGPHTAAARVEAMTARGVKPLHALADAAIGPPARACGLTAAWLLGLVDEPPPVPQVHVQGRVTRRSAATVDLHEHRLTDPAVLVRHGLPCTSVEQTVADAAREWRRGSGGLRRLGLLISRADRLRLTNPGRLRGFADAAGPVWGAALLRQALLEADGELNHSQVEGRGRRLVREAAARLGLETSRRPHPIRHEGRIVAEVDVVVARVCYGAQIDGPSHDDPRRRAVDAAQDHTLRRLGWWIDRFPAWEVDARPGAVTARVRESLQQLLAAA